MEGSYDRAPILLVYRIIERPVALTLGKNNPLSLFQLTGHFTPEKKARRGEPSRALAESRVPRKSDESQEKATHTQPKQPENGPEGP
eukprot:7859796-Pyramimonas_sp.AAC.1